jgi:hypothetical protein
MERYVGYEVRRSHACIPRRQDAQPSKLLHADKECSNLEECHAADKDAAEKRGIAGSIDF